MAFVKLDCSMLHSSIWPDKSARDIFITALLMAEPFELKAPTKQISAISLDETGWEVPAGWYGFVRAAGTGIVHMAGIDRDSGLAALQRLSSPECESRSPLHEGRRIARVDGGFIILNFFAYRDRDHTAADRMRRLRERKSLRATSDTKQLLLRNVTQAEAEAEAEADLSSSTKKEESGVPAVAAAPPVSADPGPIVAVFPTAKGKRGGDSEWAFRQSHVKELSEGFPGVDVAGEARKALLWVQAKPANRKTADGMSAFLFHWMGRAQNRGGNGNTSHFLVRSKEQESDEKVDRAFEELQAERAARNGSKR